MNLTTTHSPSSFTSYALATHYFSPFKRTQKSIQKTFSKSFPNIKENLKPNEKTRNVFSFHAVKDFSQNLYLKQKKRKMT